MNENFKAGVVSVTFRQYAYENLIKYTKLTELSCIEWGSDIHVPYDDNKKAYKTAEKMRENSIKTASYGSYYRLGVPQKWLTESETAAITGDRVDIFPMILQTAKLIEASNVRVWGGELSSASLDADARKVIVDDALRVSMLAKSANKSVSVEYHGNTITDNADSAINFIDAVRDGGGDNVYLYWQPNQHITFEENKSELKKICPYLSNIHVFAWEGSERFPLGHHRNRWGEYINIIAEQTHDSGNNKHNFLLEFVKGDNVNQFVEDAEILIELLG